METLTYLLSLHFLIFHLQIHLHIHDTCPYFHFPFADPFTYTCPYLQLSLYIDMILSNGRPFAVIHLHLHAHICSYQFTFTWSYLCTPVNLTTGNSWLIAVFAFPDILLADLMQLSIYIYMSIFAVIHLHLHDAIHEPCELNYWKLLLICCLCISWFSPVIPFAVIHLHLHAHICSLHDAIYAPLWS